MALETLTIPEDFLEEFCDLLDWALEMSTKRPTTITEPPWIPSYMYTDLKSWITEEREYLERD